MKKDFRFDPLAHRDFETIEGTDKCSFEDRIQSLNEQHIRIAIDLYIKYQDTGNWPVTGTIMHDIHNEYFKPIGIGEGSGVLSVYDSICRELADRWFNDKI